ncbi:MAG: ABC transporter permease [Candidatus Dormiibacterota bacterium]
MSTVSSAPVSLPHAPSAGKVTQMRVIASEWTKCRSLRSTRYTLLATVGLTVGLALAAAILVVSQWGTMTAVNKATFQPLNVSLVGASIGVMVIGVLGVLMMTSEYSTGLVSSTLAAVPKRLPVLWGKAVVYTFIALCVTVPAMLLAFFSTQAILSGDHVQIGFGDTGVARAVLGSALYLTIAGLLGIGLGGILRSTAAAVTSLTVILFVLPVIAFILPAGISNTISPFLPGNAGQAIMNIVPPAHGLAPWVGLGVFAAYAFAAIGVAAVLLVRRDA